MDIVLMILYATIVLGFLGVHPRRRALSGGARLRGARDGVHAGPSRPLGRLHAGGHALRRDGRAAGRLCEGVRHGGGRDEPASGAGACGAVPPRHGEHGRHRRRLRHHRRRGLRCLGQAGRMGQRGRSHERRTNTTRTGRPPCVRPRSRSRPPRLRGARLRPPSSWAKRALWRTRTTCSKANTASSTARCRSGSGPSSWWQAWP